MMKIRLSLAALFGGVVWGAMGAIVVNAEEDVVVIEDIVVRGVAVEDLPAIRPHMTYATDRETLDRRLVRSLPEALTETPGVLVQKTSNAQGSPYVRGFTGFRNLALIDDVRYNHSAMREGPNEYWALVDPYSVQSIELLPSTGAVIYGSDAVGGTLRVHTKSSQYEDYTEGQGFVGGSAFHRWHSSENSNVSRLELAFGEGQRWGFHIGATNQDFGDVRGAKVGRQPFTGYEQRALDLRFDARLNPAWEVILAHQHTQTRDAWRVHSTIHGISWRGTDVGSDLRRSFDYDRTLTYLQFRGEDPAPWLDEAVVTLSYQTLEETQTRVRSDRRRNVLGMDLDTMGIDVRMTSQTPIGRLSYGFDYYRDSVASFSEEFDSAGNLQRRRIQGPVGDDSTYELFGVYLQDRIGLREGTDLILGGRVTHARADIGRLEDPQTGRPVGFADSWTDFSGSLRLIHDLDQAGEWKAIGGISQSFRAPNLSDVSRLDVARSDTIETAAFGLGAEEFLTFEVGLRTDQPNFDASLSYYYTHIDNMIVRRPTGREIDGLREVTKANASSGYVHGVELQTEWRFANEWTGFGSVAWQRGNADAIDADGVVSREPMSRVAPLTGILGLRYAHSSGRYRTELVGRASARANRLRSSDRGDTQRIPPGGTPGHVVVDLRQFVVLHENLELDVALENILNQDYRYHGSGSNEPGFGVSVGLRARF